ncbi:MAG: rhodanese-like domain-containing protein [Bacteroidota bacterium]
MRNPGGARASTVRLLAEAGVICVLAALLGTAYTAFQGVGFFGAALPSAPVPRTPKAEAQAPQFISFEEARARFEARSALFLDSRSPYDFALGRVRGALNIPLKDFESHMDMLGNIPPGRELVTYCDGEECNSSIALAVKLDSLGYGPVKIFFGGWREWVRNGQPVDP